jgi:hypothetical protein
MPSPRRSPATVSIDLHATPMFFAHFVGEAWEQLFRSYSGQD